MNINIGDVTLENSCLNSIVQFPLGIADYGKMRDTTSRARAELTKKNVIIVGDSQLRNVGGAKLSNEHFNVTVKPMPGARIARMKNVNYADADVVIVHAGTCNLKKQSDPEELADEIVSTLLHIKSNGNKAQVAFSGIIKRKDDLELNAKAIKTNEIIVEKLMYSGFDFIDNNQIKYGYLAAMVYTLTMDV